MAAIYDLEEWLGFGNDPEGAEEALDLASALRGSSQGQYRAKKAGKGFSLVSGPGQEAFMFKESEADKWVRKLQEICASEPGASLTGDAAFARGMAKDD